MPPARNALLRLGGARADVIWPPGAPSGLLVLLGGGPAATALADEHSVVVLSCAVNDGPSLLAWAADHASELDASGALYIAGHGAPALAARASAEGWPEVALIDT